MVIDIYEDNRSVIFQTPIKDYEKVKNVVENLKYDFESNVFDDYAEIIIKMNEVVNMQKIRDIEKRYKIPFIRTEYDFSEYERRIYKKQAFNLLRRLNDEFNQSFNTIQSIIRFYVNHTLKEKGLEGIIKTTIYYSLMRLMMAEAKYINRLKMVDEFLENNFLHRFIAFYQSLSDVSKERYKSYSIESLETLGYII